MRNQTGIPNYAEVLINELIKVPISSFFTKVVPDNLVLTVTTVGTPYFRSKVPIVRRLGQLAALLTIPGVVLFTIGLIGYSLRTSAIWPIAFTQEINTALSIFFVILTILCITGSYRYSRELLATRFFGKSSKKQTPSWLAIYHTSDEAILALKLASTERLQLFGSVGIRRGVLQSVQALGLICFAAALIIGAIVLVWQIGTLSEFSQGLTLLLIPAVAVGASIPIVWLLCYLALLLVAPVLAIVGNRILNSRMYGFAVGEDHINKLDAVSIEPHTIKSRAYKLEGKWHDQMLQSTQKALKSVIESNHSELFRTDLESRLGSIPGRFESEQIFDGLIHTSYFSHRRLAKRIAMHCKEPRP